MRCLAALLVLALMMPFAAHVTGLGSELGPGLVATAQAAPEVLVRARSRVQFEGLRRTTTNGTEVVGTLTDANTGAALPGQPVDVTVAGTRYRAYTDDTGRFVIGLPALRGRHEIAFVFAGADAVEASALTVPDLEPDKQPVELGVRARIVDGGVEVVANTRADGNAVPLEGELQGGDPAALRPLGRWQAGQARIVPLTDLGGAGRRVVLATYAGSDVFAAARSEVSVDLVTPTRLTMTLDASVVAFEDAVTARGQLTDDAGAPVARAPIVLMAGDRRLAHAATDSRGGYRISLEARVLGKGSFGLQAVAEPTSPSVRGSKAPPVVVTVEAPAPVPVAFTVLAFAVTAVVALGFWWRRRRPSKPAVAAAASPTPAPAVGGVTRGRTSLASTLRRSADHGLDGVVRDAVRNRPLADAVFEVQVPGLPRSCRSDADGGVRLDDLPPGTWQAEVRAAAHVRETFAITVPHHGESRGLVIHLVPVRERAFTTYRAAAAPWLPRPDLWGVWTPRQVVDHVRARQLSPALSELTALVEEIMFSGRPYEEAVLPEIQRLVDAAIAEQPAPPLPIRPAPMGVARPDRSRA